MNSNKQKRDLIAIDPAIRGGRPTIRGMRITVGDILGWLASGMSEAVILNDFPELTQADIRVALDFASGVDEKNGLFNLLEGWELLDDDDAMSDFTDGAKG